MRDWRRRGHWLGTALTALLLAEPGVARAAECNNCCQLPCVEATINFSEGMRKLYLKLKGSKNLSQDAYEKAVAAERNRLGRESFNATGKLSQCAFNLPDPKNPNDTMRYREFISAGWGVTTITVADGPDKGQTQFAYDMRAQTNMETCSLNGTQMKLLKEYAPCTQIGAATEVHERKHLDQCKGQKKGTQHTTLLQATQEVEAYDAELEYLRAVRKSLEAACTRQSCRQEASDKDAQGLHNGLELMRAIQARSR
ncbi:hypothetical protein JY651_16460 [Pyxidicoccus parkwayensis]|uniref:Lipoprotein n=1 Tax=Pyxidicoccus parkwayensis TaxID=2813578 RepID=A0ABX7P7F7_9BACT|nr:hypothetical protein [Pyxidicoccus parkwaysis]QSQ26419.1 hypothetical protein JY651_16460 [Pyxidicoccus parkwaysis]